MPGGLERQRGGWVSGARRLTDPSHAPTEPWRSLLLQQQLFSWAQFIFCASGRQRGGWVSGAVRRTDPSHVPTEPPQDFDFWCQKVEPVPGFCGWYKHAVLFFPDGRFDCMDSSGRSSKLAVSVRQPVRLWKLYNHGESSLFGFERVGFFLVVTAGIHFGSSVQECGVISPCLPGGLLNTPWEQFADGLMPISGAAPQGEGPLLAFSSAKFVFAISWHPFLAFRWRSGDYASCLVGTGEIGPFRLAGPLRVLQRQILLPGVLTFSGFDSLAPLAGSFSRGGISVNREPAHDCCDVGLDNRQPGLGDTASACGSFLEPTWVHQLGHMLQAMLDTCALRAALLLHALLMECGTCLTAMCRTGRMLILCYLFRLLLFGWTLKGGTCNCDNLLLGARSATAAVPWRFGVGLLGFSPRLQSNAVATNNRGRRCSYYSADLFLLIFLIATFIDPAAAANSRRPSAHPTEFPAAPVYQDDETLERGLLQDPDVAEDLVPDPGVVGPPPTIYITRAYKLIGFGHQPEYVSSATTSTATFQRCLELLEPDLGVRRTGGTGALYPLRGPAVIDELQAQWIPDWVHSALGRLVVIDASLLGYTPFQVYAQDGIISYHRVNRIMPALVDQEYYIFIPSQDGDPLAYDGYPSRMIVDHGDAVHLTPDPAPPQAVQDVQWAFDHFSDWSLTEFADGYDEPVGEQHVMVLSDRENFLLVAIEEPFERPMYYQYHLCDIVFLLETPLTGSELVVFVDSRPVLQTFSAVRLPHPRNFGQRSNCSVQN